MSSLLAEQCAESLRQVRKNKPLIHNITNYVVMNYTANVLLAMGASPVMAHAANEVEEMVGFAGSLVLNIGTLSDPWTDSMILAGRKAAAQGTPIILDPVGSGATTLRTATAKKILTDCRVSILRGNSSEILSLGKETSTTRGVDATHTVTESADTATELAQELATTIAITGPVDLITDGSRVVRVENGHPMMPYVTGTGCAATAVISAFAAVEQDMVAATVGGLAFLGIAGELAGKTANGPGSFMIALLDALYAITPGDLLKDGKIFEG